MLRWSEREINNQEYTRTYNPNAKTGFSYFPYFEYDTYARKNTYTRIGYILNIKISRISDIFIVYIAQLHFVYEILPYTIGYFKYCYS